jgi:hypothetical protein
MRLVTTGVWVVGLALALPLALAGVSGCHRDQATDSHRAPIGIRAPRRVASSSSSAPNAAINAVPSVPAGPVQLLEIPLAPEHQRKLPPPSRDVYENALSFLDHLPRPALYQGSSQGNCSSTLVVDSLGRVWSEHGCEGHSSGAESEGRLTASERAKFAKAMAQWEREPRPLKQAQHCSSSITWIRPNGTTRQEDACNAASPALNEALDLMRAPIERRQSSPDSN